MSNDVGYVFVDGQPVGEFMYSNTVDMAPGLWLPGVGRTWHEVRGAQRWPDDAPCAHERRAVVLSVYDRHWPATACVECRRIYAGNSPYGVDGTEDRPAWLHRDAIDACPACPRSPAKLSLADPPDPP